MNNDRQGGQGGQGGQKDKAARAGTGGRSGRSRHRHHYRGNQGQGGGQQGQRPPQHQQGNRNNPSPSRAPSSVISDIEKAYNAKTPIDPIQWIQLEKGSQEISMRAMDLLCPIGRGTRGLIVAPPKAGKTTFLKQISNAVHGFDPKIRQYCLLIDERPEEVTDFKRSVPAEVFASSSDQSYDKHITVANELIKLAVGQAAAGEDVFILLDSLTRWRACTTNSPRAPER